MLYVSVSEFWVMYYIKSHIQCIYHGTPRTNCSTARSSKSCSPATSSTIGIFVAVQRELAQASNTSPACKNFHTHNLNTLLVHDTAVQAAARQGSQCGTLARRRCYRKRTLPMWPDKSGWRIAVAFPTRPVPKRCSWLFGLDRLGRDSQDGRLQRGRARSR